MDFKVLKQDAATRARIGKLRTSRGSIETPTFMPVATCGAVKGLSCQDLLDCGVQIVLSNAYHLYLRPGIEVVKKAGGIHKFIGWRRPILTDSGGYQLFSLAILRKVFLEGVEFQSHIDGSRHFLTPEKVIQIQAAFLGSDMIMPLDECLPYPMDKAAAERSLRLTNDWARRSKGEFIVYREQFTEKAKTKLNNGQPSTVNHQQLFGIIQGSSYLDLRKEAAERLVEMDFQGYCLGGLSVGEPEDLRYNIIEHTLKFLPKTKPVYLMGVGTPLDILKTVGLGIDMFDCVVPTRHGRSGTAFTKKGKINLRNSEYIHDFRPIDEGCSCFACQRYLRSYIRHLLLSSEMLGSRLVSFHNIHFYAHLMRQIRKAIAQDRFEEFRKGFIREYEESD